jgi:hypothetical protein
LLGSDTEERLQVAKILRESENCGFFC